MNDGTLLESPPLTLDAQQITDFARRFDPQPYHLDEAAAAASIFGGLCASGWQVADPVIGIQWRFEPIRLERRAVQ